MLGKLLQRGNHVDIQGCRAATAPGGEEYVCRPGNTVVHMKRSCCGCDHVFTLKRKVQVSADKYMGKAVKRRRALETVEDTLRRQAQNRNA